MRYSNMAYPHPEDVLPRTSYISVVIPTFCRPFYLEKALDTLAQFADMPYEVIVHDDGSRPEFRDEVYRMSHHISTLIFNNGMNLGLGESANRCVALASSEYVLFLNDDCFFVGACLRDLSRVLSRPYIGFLSVANDIGPQNDRSYCHVDGTGLLLSNYLGGGSTIAFRKKTWQEVGGFDYRSTSGQADNVFIYKILRAGYWKGILDGADRIKVGNFVYGDDYKPTQGYLTGNDCSVPKIFNMEDAAWKVLHHRRREACQWWVDGERTIPGRPGYDGRENPKAGLNDIPYWQDYFQGVFGGHNSNSASDIDWVVAERHGQVKWRKQISEDFRLEQCA